MHCAIVLAAALRLGGFAPPQAPAAGPPVIDHAPLSCVRPDQNPVVVAGVTAVAAIRRSRVYFKAHQYPDWYYVDMASEQPPQFDAVLPQPLPGTAQIDYYLQALDANLESAQTREYDPEVTRDGCRKKPAAALERADRIVVGATKAGQPAIPPGFSAKGIVAFVTAAGATLTGADLSTTSPPGPAATGPGTGGVGGGAGAGSSGGPAVSPASGGEKKGGGAKLALILVGAAAVGGGVALAAHGGGGGGGGQTTTTTTLTPTFALGVSIAGTGTGSVATPDGRISCPGTCSAAFPAGGAVQLTAAAASGSVFGGWSGDASSCGAAAQCSLTMDAAKNVTARFDPVTSGPKKLYVAKQSTGTAGGTGTVTSGDGFINCGPGCTQAQHNYGAGAHVTLNATPSPGSKFVGFTGACGTAVPKCSLVMDQDQDVTAVFFADAPAGFTLTVTLPGKGTGSVVSRDGNINCGSTCSATYSPGSSVVLAVNYNPNTDTFAGWGGDVTRTCGANPTCTVVMDAAKNVTATFNPIIIAESKQVRSWTSELAVARASARVLVNGDEVVLPTSGRSEHTLHVRPGQNRLEARLVQPAAAGTWRFAFAPGALEPGSLRVQQGDAVLVTEDSVVFRLSGRADEVVAFTFRGKAAP